MSSYLLSWSDREPLRCPLATLLRPHLSPSLFLSSLIPFGPLDAMFQKGGCVYAGGGWIGDHSYPLLSSRSYVHLGIRRSNKLSFLTRMCYVSLKAGQKIKLRFTENVQNL